MHQISNGSKSEELHSDIHRLKNLTDRFAVDRRVGEILIRAKRQALEVIEHHEHAPDIEGAAGSTRVREYRFGPDDTLVEELGYIEDRPLCNTYTTGPANPELLAGTEPVIVERGIGWAD